MDNFKKLDDLIAKLVIIRAETERLRTMSADARALSEAARFQPPLVRPADPDDLVARAWCNVDPGPPVGAVKQPLEWMEDEEMPMPNTGRSLSEQEITLRHG